MWIEEWLRGHTFDARIRDCRFRLDGEVGIRFDGSQGAVVRDCDFSGPGEAGIYALDAEGLRLVGNDFCDLEPSNAEEASVVVAGTTTIVDKDNDCIDFFTEQDDD
ncbi:MAG: right-handed parallel beta-helix repeat-containing protein [Actinobacteria bacterium]|nr:right-handed parallel beta-helix repeat-containing protein [Actinomycetota bacterium]